MFKKILKTDLMNLINRPGLFVTTYVDLKERSIVVFQNKVKETEALVRIPDIEELYPYGEAMSDFIDEWKLNIPFKMKAGRYLRENGYIHEFYVFRDNKAADRLSEWLDSYQIVSCYNS